VPRRKNKKEKAERREKGGKERMYGGEVTCGGWNLVE